MPDKTTELANLLTNAMNETAKNKTSEYDTIAKVTRIDDDGQAWVNIPGGVRETPVRSGVSVKQGDEVQVHVGGGRAFMQGNYTSPPTDDTRANQAYGVASDALDSAVIAKTAADSAVESAEIAKDAADEATEQLIVVNSAVETIQSDLQITQQAADDATTYAQESLRGLSVVQDVVGVLDYISKYGQYVISTDTEVVEGRLYFEITDSAQVLQPIEEDKGKYYEYDLQTGIYTLTDQEAALDPLKTYYVITVVKSNPTGTESPVELGLYQFLNVEEAMQHYILSHLALMDDGLHIIKDDQSKYIVISNDAVEIRDGDTVLAKYGEYTVIGDINSTHIELKPRYVEVTDATQSDNPFYQGWYELINGAYVLTSDTTVQGGKTYYEKEGFLGFYDQNGAEPVAYITNNMLWIPYAVVVDSLQVGDGKLGAWRWVVQDATRHLTLTWLQEE